jgi:hypothetical protein
LILSPKREKLIDRKGEFSGVVGEVVVEVVAEVVVVEGFSSTFDSWTSRMYLQLGHTCHSTLGESSNPVAGEESGDCIRQFERTEIAFEVLTLGCSGTSPLD